eukprot:4115392-Pleurochrysis_carterae.AAC.1
MSKEGVYPIALAPRVSASRPQCEAVGYRGGERVSTCGGPGSCARKLVDAREELILRRRADRTYPRSSYHEAASDVHARPHKKARYRYRDSEREQSCPVFRAQQESGHQLACKLRTCDASYNACVAVAGPGRCTIR